MSHTYKNYRFRKASNHDQTKIIDLISLVLSEYQLEFDTNAADADLLDIEQNYFGNNGYFGVITTPDNDKIIGTFGLYNLGNQVGEIKKMYLLKQHRGKGLGKYALQFLIGQAKTLNYKKLEIETASVLHEAIALYKNFGFTMYEKKNVCASRCDTAMQMILE